MTAQLSWPDSYFAGRSRPALGGLLRRLAALAEGGSLPATLMLVGQAGLGREALAVELAAALICRSGGRPGCECGSCERVRRGVHPDFEVLDVAPGKSDIAIDQVRAVVDNVLQRPFEGRHRVYLIASSHNPPLNEHAASAFLKTLEEPPPHATILLLAVNPARVLPTIVSRAVLLRVPPPSEPELIDLLATHHGVGVEQAAVLLAAAGGHPALALHAVSPEAAEAPARLRDLLSNALCGDALALLRLASVIRQATHGVALAVALLLDALPTAGPEAAEGLLDAALALLRAERRRAALRVDLEGAVIGALAPSVRACREE